MYELNNKVRLINVPDYMISDADEFIGFISGIISQDHDLELPKKTISIVFIFG